MRIIERTIEIAAPADIVWQVFTDPELTRQMGGEYVTSWKPGGSIAWKNLEGKMLTGGRILQAEAGKLLQHELFDLEDNNRILSRITYKFSEDNGSTTLNAREEVFGDPGGEFLKYAGGGWDYALDLLKKVAEEKESGK